jgi:AraC-like DNA-binding protein
MGYALRCEVITFSDGHQEAAHNHGWGQLIYAATGTMRVVADNALWLIPQGRALWVPPGTEHAITMRGSVAMRTIYIPPGRAGALPEHTEALEVDALLRELILHIAPMRLLREDMREHERLATLFLDRLSRAGRSMFMVPMPRASALKVLAEKLRDDPVREASLPALARAAGMSVRTLQRRFREETGLRFVEWRQRLKLMHAITMLGAGASVTEAGSGAGYANTSAFIAAFRAHMGETPKAFVRGAKQV